MKLEKAQKFKLYIGLNDKDSYKQEVDTAKAVELVNAYCGDCTLFNASGVYTDDKGITTKEATIIAEVFGKTDGEIESIALSLKQELNQDSIIVAREIVESAFI